ncbi:ATP-binding protein [Ferirhizobium litorale]|uniref:ATP-binding protein n=1 Tax=Ferirhizobium litorale TaxID=2927786 RepID=UPI00352FFD74
MRKEGVYKSRGYSVKLIERCLFQSKNGSPQHFLVQGERGIGKSSLLLYVEMIADGKTRPILTDQAFRFVTVSVDLGGCQSQIDIVRKFGRGLKTALSTRDAVKQAASGFWNWLTNWEVLGVRYHKDQSELDAEEVCDELVTRLSNLCNVASSEIDGVLLLIDEADRPPTEAGLGELLKMLTERLSRTGCNSVVFGVAGLPTILGKLRESHESSPRLFHTLLLEPLEPSERKRVVNLGLKAANERNTVPTSITDEGLDFLAVLSEGYPHFLQQFGYSAFEHDTDDEIDMDDVGEGAFKAGGALAQLGDKFFNEMYHARISSEDYRRVLDAMAEHGDSWVARKTIIAESGVSEASVNNALQSLKLKEIIIQDDTRRGFYRLPTNSFAAWINAIRAARAQADASGSADF